MDTGLFNQIYEQYLFTCLAAEKGIDIHYYLPEMNEEYTQVLDFHLLPSIQSYIHVVGKAKRNPLACQQVEYRLRYEFPEYYDRMLDFLGEKKHALAAFHSRKSGNEEKELLTTFFYRTLFLLNYLNGKKHDLAMIDALEEVVDKKTGIEDMASKALGTIFTLEKQKYQLCKKKTQPPMSNPFREVEQIYRLRRLTEDKN